MKEQVCEKVRKKGSERGCVRKRVKKRCKGEKERLRGGLKKRDCESEKVTLREARVGEWKKRRIEIGWLCETGWKREGLRVG